VHALWLTTARMRHVTLFLFKQKRNLSVLFKQTAFLCLKSFNIAPKTRFLA